MDSHTSLYSKEIINDKSFADEFNQFFLSVGPSAVYEIKSMVYEFSFDLDKESSVPKQYPFAEQFTFRTTECKHVEEIIMYMPSHKAPGTIKSQFVSSKMALRQSFLQLPLS